MTEWENRRISDGRMGEREKETKREKDTERGKKKKNLLKKLCN